MQRFGKHQSSHNIALVKKQQPQSIAQTRDIIQQLKSKQTTTSDERNKLLVQIQREKQAAEKLQEEKTALAKEKQQIIADLPHKDLSLDEFNALRTKEIQHARKEHDTQHRKRSLELQLALRDTREDLMFKHIIIGAGVGATTLFIEFPPEVCKKNPYHPQLPGILVLRDPSEPHTWVKEGNRLMGQPSALHGDFLPVDSDTCNTKFDQSDSENPYNYVAACNFYDAVTASQDVLEMPIVSMKALRIETRAELTGETNAPWTRTEAPHRILVEGGRYLYTHAIEICTGLGPARKLTDEQVSPEAAKEKNKIIYACDGDVELKGDVLFYGGSAVNASLTAEILKKRIHTEANVTYLVSPNVAPLDEMPTTLNRLIADACDAKTIPMALGTIKKATLLENKKLEITFDAPNTSSDKYTLLTGRTIICDQLVVARGQVPNALYDHLKNFVVCMDEEEQIPLGTCSPDMSIRTWGAAGSTLIGIPSTKRAEYKQLIKNHADTTLVENNAEGGISRSSDVIPKMAKILVKAGMFPSTERHQPHALQIPRINQASLHDLTIFFTETDSSLTKQDAKTYAQAVITERLKRIPHSKEPTGIYSISRLIDILPDHLVEAVQERYFPFGESLVEIRVEKMRKATSAAGEAAVTVDSGGGAGMECAVVTNKMGL